MKFDFTNNFNLIGENPSYDKFSKIIHAHLEQFEKNYSHPNPEHPKTASIIRSLVKKSSEIEGMVHFEEVGTIQHIGNGVANISGLSQAAIDELVDFKNNSQGLILNLQTDSLDVILLGSEQGIQGGSLVTHQSHKLNIPVSRDLVGRIVNALGIPVDSGPEIKALEYRFIDNPAPDITSRSPVDTPLHTGTKIIDALFPIGKGQRELILGDRQTGKTTIALDAIINQKGKNVACIYVSIGQKKSSLMTIVDVLKKNKAFAHTIIVAASTDDPPAQKYLAPFSGMTIAEYFLDQGEDVLIIFDDLSKHADAYREISLLLRRPPGREAYPGDIFYLHSRLLERAGRLNQENKGGSITAIPILTTQQGNVSAYIPTNLISICDGQIVLDRDKFNKGFKPAVNIGTSVSRVGGAAQTKIIRSLANSLKLDLSQFEEVERFTRFGTELDETTKNMIGRGQRLQEVLTQPIHQPNALNEQALLLFAATRGYLDSIPIDQVKPFGNQLLKRAAIENSNIMEMIESDPDLSDELTKLMSEFLDMFTSNWHKEEENNE